jgi:hypothetical protein
VAASSTIESTPPDKATVTFSAASSNATARLTAAQISSNPGDVCSAKALQLHLFELAKVHEAILPALKQRINGHILQLF